jgi:cytochrome c553
VKQFLTGFLTGVVFLLLAAAAVAWLGLVDVRADAAIPPWFAAWFSSSVHRSVIRQAATVNSLAPASQAEIIAGGKLYVNDCAGCHGAPGETGSEFGATFYPPVPQLALHGTSYSEKQIFWIAKHGVRRSGMASQSDSYSDEKLLLLAAFISRIKALPPDVVLSIKQKPESTTLATEPKP